MKKVAPLLISFCLFMYYGLLAQSVDNGDLEDWEIQETMESTLLKENPKGWTSRNHVDNNPQAIFCYRTTDSYSGEKAAVLQNFSPSPGISLSSYLSLGVFNLQTPNKRGVAFSERPYAMHFAYKYFTTEVNPSGFYATKALIQLTKWDDQAKEQVIIGKGEYQITHKSNFYQPTEVLIEYFSNAVPDSMQIIFTTPNNPDDQVRFTLDNIYLEMEVTTVGNSDKVYFDQVSLFPNPVNDWLTFFNPLDFDDAELLVYNSVGQLLLNKPISGTGGKIDCHNLIDGMYFYQIRQSDQLVKAGKLTKNSL